VPGAFAVQHATPTVRCIATCRAGPGRSLGAPGERGRHGACSGPTAEEHLDMLDIVFILASVTFFAVAWAYALGCDRLMEARQP